MITPLQEMQPDGGDNGDRMEVDEVLSEEGLQEEVSGDGGAGEKRRFGRIQLVEIADRIVVGLVVVVL